MSSNANKSSDELKTLLYHIAEEAENDDAAALVEEFFLESLEALSQALSEGGEEQIRESWEMLLGLPVGEDRALSWKELGELVDSGQWVEVLKRRFEEVFSGRKKNEKVRPPSSSEERFIELFHRFRRTLSEFSNVMHEAAVESGTMQSWKAVRLSRDAFADPFGATFSLRNALLQLEAPFIERKNKESFRRYAFPKWLEDQNHPIGMGKLPSPNELIKLFSFYSDKARREGLLALEDEADESISPIVRKGIFMVVDGTDPYNICTSMRSYFRGARRRLEGIREDAREGVTEILRSDFSYFGDGRTDFDTDSGFGGLSSFFQDRALEKRNGVGFGTKGNREEADRFFPIYADLLEILQKYRHKSEYLSDALDKVDLLFSRLREELSILHRSVWCGVSTIQEGGNPEVMRERMNNSFAIDYASSIPDSLLRFAEALKKNIPNPRPVHRALERLIGAAVDFFCEWKKIEDSIEDSMFREKCGNIIEKAEEIGAHFHTLLEEPQEAELFHADRRSRFESFSRQEKEKRVRIWQALSQKFPQIEQEYARRRPGSANIHKIVDSSQLIEFSLAALELFLAYRNSGWAHGQPDKAHRDSGGKEKAPSPEARKKTLIEKGEEIFGFRVDDFEDPEREVFEAEVALQLFPEPISRIAPYLRRRFPVPGDREYLWPFVFRFEYILELDDRAVQKVFREIDSSNLARAMKDCSEEVEKKIFSNMSRCAAETIQDERESLGQLPFRETRLAQRRFIDVVERLVEMGEISTVY